MKDLSRCDHEVEDRTDWCRGCRDYARSLPHDSDESQWFRCPHTQRFYRSCMKPAAWVFGTSWLCTVHFDMATKRMAAARPVIAELRGVG